MQTSPAKQLQCMEVWGGNRVVDSGVIMPGLDAWLYSQPCEHESAGGDVHYVSTCAGGCLVRMLVADVAGHGAVVADIAQHLRQLMRRYINTKTQTKFIQSLNREFTTASSNGLFATAVVMTFDAPTSSLMVSNAGHPPPLWYQSKPEKWTYLHDADKGELPWGIEESTEYEQFSVRLNVGDIVLGYTDSLTEARNPDGELIGPEGLIDLVQGLGPPDPSDLVSRLLAELERRDKANLTRDDVTCLMVRANGLRRRVPIRDLLLAPMRIMADWAGLHFNWTQPKRADA